MTLLHEPEGDRNPYEAVPWSRQPLVPEAGQTLQIGVRSSGVVDGVVLEWQAGTASGESRLRSDGHAWVGSLGPFKETCRYRFVALLDGAAHETTPWFTAPVTRWLPLRFEGVEELGGRITAFAEEGRMVLAPRQGTSIGWSLERGGNSGSTSVSARAQGWDVTLGPDGEVRLACDGFEMPLRVDLAVADGAPQAWRLRWGLTAEERILGGGERFDRLDQRGRRPDVRVYAQFTSQGTRTYIPVPWLLSTRGYGLAIDGSTRICFDLGATRPDEASVSVPTSGTAAGRWYLGSPTRVLGEYTADLGTRPTVPIWAYGPWMSSNEWDSERRVREVVTRTEDEGIPATVLVIEAWSDEATFYLFNDTTHDLAPGSEPVPAASMRHGGRWPDPKALVQWLHERGLRCMLWQIPVLKEVDGNEQHDQDVAHAEAAGLCVETDGGGSYRNRDWWFPRSRVIDFSNAAAREWWFAKRDYLLEDIGVDGFKTDGGEHLWGSDVRLHDGSSGDEAANRYPTQYLAAYHQFLRSHGHESPLTFARAGFTGSQILPAHWAGDEASTWEALRATLTAGLSAGASGIGLWGWDIAGFTGPLPSAELYKRAAAMATFSPIMQYHSDHNEHQEPLADRTPWNVAKQTGDDGVVAIYRFFARLRMNLVPLLYGLGQSWGASGLPLMRALAIEYPEDDVAAGVDDQFLLGSDVLVAPVLEPGVRERRVYVPKGTWHDFWSAEPVATGWHTLRAPIDRIPVLVRGGSPLPLWMPREGIALAASIGLPAIESGRLVLMVLPGSAERLLTDPIDGRTWTVAVERDGDTLQIDAADPPANAIVWVRGPSGFDHRVAIPLQDGRVRVRLGGHED